MAMLSFPLYCSRAALVLMKGTTTSSLMLIEQNVEWLQDVRLDYEIMDMIRVTYGGGIFFAVSRLFSRKIC